MVTLANALLTDTKDINEAMVIEMIWDGRKMRLFGPAVMGFVEATNMTYTTFPGIDCLAVGLEMLPSEMRPVYEYLYEELKEVIK